MAAEDFSIEIRGGAVARKQRVLAVPHQAQVRIAWLADRPMTVHLEGYDLSLVVRPGSVEAMEFNAHITGRFAVHAHEGVERGKHSHGRGALLWLEVHPK